MFSEAHCHFLNPSDDDIKQLEKVGVELVLTSAGTRTVLGFCSTDLASCEQAILAARKYRILKACVGIHPYISDQYSKEALNKLKKLATNAEVVGISETGLDYVMRRTREGKWVEECVDKQVQRTAFREHLRVAKELDLPVIVHDNTPGHEVLDILEEEGNAKIGVAIHGFDKDMGYAERAMSMKIYLSIGLRDISAPENEVLKESIKQIPLEWLLTETDSENPEGVLTVAEKIAELKGLTRDDVGRATTRNLRRLIRL